MKPVKGSMKPKTCATVLQRKTFRPLFVRQTVKFDLKTLNGFEIIFIFIAILEFILTTVKQIKRKNDGWFWVETLFQKLKFTDWQFDKMEKM